MLYREIMAVCSQIHTKHINTVSGQNVELLNVKLAVRIVTTGLQKSQPKEQALNIKFPDCYRHPNCVQFISIPIHT
jgi:hypothetical protein